MNIKLTAGILIGLVIIVAIVYMFNISKTVTPPKTGMLIDQQIDSIIGQEMDRTLANVSQADVEQILLS